MRRAFLKMIYILISILLLVIIAVPIYINYWRGSSTINSFTEFKEPKNLVFSKIKWTSNFLNDKEINKAALFVPVKIKGLEGNLFMQFDTGTKKSIIYGKTLEKILIDKTKIQTFYDKDSVQFFKNISIVLGETLMKSNKIRISQSMGDKKIDTSFINIGTIGFDAIVNRTLILDFKNDLLAITERASDSLNYTLEEVKNASVNKFPLLIPAKIGKEKTRLFYDTGSSMFSLITSNKKLKSINHEKIDTICCISNWGRKIPVHRKKLSTSISLGNYSFKNDFVYGCEILNIVDYLPNWFLFGITGNKMFDKQLIVIDVKNNKFGIQK